VKPSGKKHVQWYYALLLAVASLILYEPSKPENSSGDTISTRFWPVAILKHKTWTLTPFKEELRGVGYAALSELDGSALYPRNGWGMALVTVPVYAVADALDLGGTEWTPDRINAVSRWNAALIAVLSVVLMYFFLERFASARVALVSAALFAFGSWNWSIGAQGLFSQATAVMFHLINLHLLWRICVSKTGAARSEAMWIGAVHTVIWSLRPQDVLLIAPTLLVMREKRLLKPYAIAGLGTLLPLMLMYKEAYGYWLGAYGAVEAIPGQSTFRLDGWLGFVGLLFSPNRGAIVFYPLFLFAPFVWKKLFPALELKRLWKEKTTRPASGKQLIPENFHQVTALGVLGYFFFLCFIRYWHGTWGYGPRYLYDTLPYIWPSVTVLLIEVGGWLRSEKTLLPRWALALAVVACVQSVAIHALGHMNYSLYIWNHYVVPVNDEKAWKFDELMLKHVWRAGSNQDRWKDDALSRLKKLGY
jgi:hypothetical protein